MFDHLIHNIRRDVFANLPLVANCPRYVILTVVNTMGQQGLHKLEAVRLVRSAFGVHLYDAKCVVDQIYKHGYTRTNDPS